MLKFAPPESMSKQLSCPGWDSSSSALIFTLSDRKTLKFKVFVVVEKNILAPASWLPLPDGSVIGRVDGVEIKVGFRPVKGYEKNEVAFVSITNIGRTKLKFGGFKFSAMTEDFPAGENLRVYKEGWAMTTPAASVRYGDKDFFLNPDYKFFASSVPAEYDDASPNRFFADYAIVINDKANSNNIFAGFISSENQVARFTLEIGAKGLVSLDAICDGEGIEIDPGECVNSEELLVMSGSDGYSLLETFAWLWGNRMNAITWDHIPTGWCSWAYYFEKITQSDMLENSSWLSSKISEYPVEYVQMDDGYQAALGDWLICDAEKFPDGLEFLAKKIKADGFKPGIWLAPFFVAESSQLYAAHSEWTVKDVNGNTAWAVQDWRGSRVGILDCTNPDACAWLTELFVTLSGYGYEYYKLDFLVHAAGIRAMGGVYSDPKATRVQFIRRGLAAIRKGVGDDKLILGCTLVLGAGVGIVNACRIATDFLPAWNINNEPFKEAPTAINVCRNIINRRYMHKRLWVNDADAHIARIDNNKLSEDEVKMFTSALWITGGMMLSGDRFSTLSDERGKLFQMLLKDLDAFDEVRPLDIFAEEYPSIWLGKNGNGRWRTVIGAFNFDESIKRVKIDLNMAGFKSGTKLNVHEFWSNEDFVEMGSSFFTEIKPHACKIFLLEV